MIYGPVRRTGPDGYTSLYYMVGKWGKTGRGIMKYFIKLNAGQLLSVQT